MQGSRLGQQVGKLDETWNRETQQGDKDHRTHQLSATGDTVLSRDETALKQGMRYLNRKDKDREQLEAEKATNQEDTRLKFVTDRSKSDLNRIERRKSMINFDVRRINTNANKKPLLGTEHMNDQKQDNDDTELSNLLENYELDEADYKVGEQAVKEYDDTRAVKHFKSMVIVVFHRYFLHQ